MATITEPVVNVLLLHTHEHLPHELHNDPVPANAAIIFASSPCGSTAFPLLTWSLPNKAWNKAWKTGSWRMSTLLSTLSTSSATGFAQPTSPPQSLVHGRPLLSSLLHAIRGDSIVRTGCRSHPLAVCGLVIKELRGFARTEVQGWNDARRHRRREITLHELQV
ncbi:hypothetical protein CCMA1212_007863 [Trichoderma ghanense]|uniref:Uncharacterized protein n=1 Tax=Trichoderma ghanense TaxID=65468 RepID=A0ABY2GY21_9HYPO